MTKKILAVLCAAAMLTGSVCVQASAEAAVDTDASTTTDATTDTTTEDAATDDTTTESDPAEETIADLLAAAAADESAYFSGEDGRYVYITPDDLTVYEIARVCYTITLEEGGILTEDVADVLSAAFTNLSKHPDADPVVPVTVADAVPETTFGSLYGGVTLVTNEDGTYDLWFSPSQYRLDEAALAAYLETIPTFVGVTEDLYGCDFDATGGNYSVLENEVHVTVPEGETLTEEDLAAAGVAYSEVSFLYDNIYIVTPPTEVPVATATADLVTGPNTPLLYLVEALQAVEKAETITPAVSMTEMVYHADDHLLPHAPTSYFMRGDCDENGTITINDAFDALIEYASVAAGLDGTLSGLSWYAADVNGDDAVMIMDAYNILVYYANLSAGNDPQWYDLLVVPEEPEVATDTTELTEDTTEDSTEAPTEAPVEEPTEA